MVRGDQKNSKAESGAILIIVAVCLIMIFGFAALVIDGAYIYTTQNQLHVAADSAALAGASQIVDPSDCAESVPPTDYTAPETTWPSCAPSDPNCNARRLAKKFAAFHKAGSAAGQTAINLSLNTGNDQNGDIILGNFDPAPTSRIFTACPAGTPVNAVQVRSRRNSEKRAGIDPSNAPISTFFAPVLNTLFKTRDVKTFATAMNGVRATTAVCVSSCMLSGPSCSTIVTLTPDSGGTAAWTGFFEGANDQNIIAYITGTKQIPVVGLGQSINITNGTLGNAYKKLADATSGHPSPWQVYLPICNTPLCTLCAATNFGAGSYSVSGLAVFNITSVNIGAKEINGFFSSLSTITPSAVLVQ